MLGLALVLLSAAFSGAPLRVAPTDAGVQRPASIVPQDTAVVIYLVRHAERLDDTEDSPLNPAGQARARELARLLGAAGVTRIWSTPFRRTRATTAPLAARLGLEVEPYDASRLDAFAARVKAIPGRHLVVGHSNTTPELVRALGGEPHGAIQYDEYDRLYVVVLGSGETTSLLLRFGAGQAP